MSWDPRKNLLFNANLQYLLVFVIVLLANFWAAQHFIRLDLTRQRLFSLDNASKNIVGTLDKPLVVKAWFTRGLEAPYNNHEQAFRDKLDEFRAYSHGKMQITVQDPADDPEILKDAQKYGLQALDYTVKQADRSELRRIWMGAVILYGDRQEVLPSLTDMTTLEYEVASAIHRLQVKAEDKPVIGLSTGHGEPDFTKPEGPIRTLLEGMAKKAVLTPIPLGGAGSIPKEVDALLVVGPQNTLSDRALYQIDQFLMRGGSAGIFLMNTRPDMKTFRPVPVFSGLEPLLGHYGIQVNRDVLLDRVENGPMRFPVRVGQNTGYREINYPLIPRITDFSKDSMLTSGADQMLFPFASSLNIATDLPMGVTAEVLAKSSNKSGAIKGLTTVDPTQLTNVIPGEERGPFPVMVALTGSLRSFFETRPPPRPEAGATAIPGPNNEPAEEQALIVEGGTTRLVVSGSADVVANNLSFMMNLTDWLVQDTALIGIRSKDATVPPMASTTNSEQLAWKVFNLLSGPLVLLGYGMFRQWRRRAS